MNIRTIKWNSNSDFNIQAFRFVWFHFESFYLQYQLYLPSCRESLDPKCVLDGYQLCPFFSNLAKEWHFQNWILLMFTDQMVVSAKRPFSAVLSLLPNCRLDEKIGFSAREFVKNKASEKKTTNLFWNDFLLVHFSFQLIFKSFNSSRTN